MNMGWGGRDMILEDLMEDIGRNRVKWQNWIHAVQQLGLRLFSFFFIFFSVSDRVLL